MTGKIFRWLIAPAGLILAWAIVEGHVESRPHVMLVSFLSGGTMGLYFGLLLLKRKNSG